MEYIRSYFLTNFFLLCVSFGVIFMVLRSNTRRKEDYLMPILIVSSAVLLSIVYAVEGFCLDKPELTFLATFCFFVGFAIRPLILYFFMRLSVKNKIILRISLIAVIVNALVYAVTLFIHVPELSHLIYWYSSAEGHLVHNRGPLYYFAYVIVGAMMAYLVFFSISSLTGRHRYDALASLICLVFIIVAVILETVFYDGTLLNTTIAISCLFYVVHVYQQAAKRDGLTGLYDRRTYYSDAAHLGPKIAAIIMVDMNYLKHINDTEGHLAGDVAINAVARVLEKARDRRCMYVYRLGGDEFLIVSTSTQEGTADATAARVKELLAETPYCASVGVAVRTSPEQTVEDLFVKAEQSMYGDKEEFYRTSGIERRKNGPRQ